MASAEMVGRVIAAITAVLGPDAPIEGIRVALRPGGAVRVDLTTSLPGRLIGRRGATADALRARLADDLGAEVELNIHEARPEEPPSDPPFEPPSGVREPRRPRPADPSGSAALDPPLEPEPEHVDPPATGRPVLPPPAEHPTEHPTEHPRPHRRGAA